MADLKISDMLSAGSVADGDVLPIVQTSTNKKSAFSVVKTYIRTAFDAVYVPLTRTVNGHALSADISLTASDVGLGSVTNDTQTKAAIVPNTIPSAGQILAGNAGGTAYHPVTLSGSGATVTLSSAGVVGISAVANASLVNSAITIAGNSTALGGAVTQDQITGLSGTGIVKHTGVNALAIATADADYTANSFKTISVAGQSNVVADSAADTLTLAAGANVTITTNATTDTVTIASSGGGGGTIASTNNVLKGDGAGNAVAVGTATAGKVLIGDGTNFVPSTPTYPNASAASGKILKSDGTNFVASTETYAAPGTNGNVLTSDGTNWTSAAPAGGSVPHAVTFVVDGSGIALTTGTKNPIKIAFGGTLQGWLLIGSPSGSVTVDILRAADGAGLPVTSIIGGSGTKPALSSAVENSSTSFTAWTSTTLTAKDNMAISLSGITACTYVALTLYFS